MEGNSNEICEKGIIPRCISYIYSVLKSKNISDNTVKVSCLELYKEDLYDLLSEGDPNIIGNMNTSTSDIQNNSLNPMNDKNKRELRIYEDGGKGTFVDGLEEIVVSDENHILEILKLASFKRKIAETELNKRSSRSHLITTITVHIREQTPDGEECKYIFF